MPKTDQRRKQQIVRAAFEALKTHGLPSISYDLIAKHGSISRQLVRYHYGNPEDLMVDVLDLMAATYRETMIMGVMQKQGQARVKLFLDFFFDMLDDTPKPADDTVFDAMMSLSVSTPRVKRALRQHYSVLGELLAREFETQYPDLTPQAAKELSFLFTSLMYGHWKMVSSLGFSREHKHITRAAMDRLIESYTKTRPETVQTVPVWMQSA